MKLKLFLLIFSAMWCKLSIAQENPVFLWSYDNMFTQTKASWSFGFEFRPIFGKRLTLSYPLSVGTHYGQKRLYVHTTAGGYLASHVLSDTTASNTAGIFATMALIVPEGVGVYIGPDVNPYLHLFLGFAGMDYWKTFGKPNEDSRYVLSIGAQYIPTNDWGWRKVVPFIKVFSGTSFNNGVNEWGVKFGVSFTPDNSSPSKAPWFMPRGR